MNRTQRYLNELAAFWGINPEYAAAANLASEAATRTALGLNEPPPLPQASKAPIWPL